jgi:hypothetical protein
MKIGETVFKASEIKIIRISIAKTVTIPAIASPMWDFFKIGVLSIAVFF